MQPQSPTVRSILLLVVHAHRYTFLRWSRFASRVCPLVHGLSLWQRHHCLTLITRSRLMFSPRSTHTRTDTQGSRGITKAQRPVCCPGMEARKLIMGRKRGSNDQGENYHCVLLCLITVEDHSVRQNMAFVVIASLYWWKSVKWWSYSVLLWDHCRFYFILRRNNLMTDTVTMWHW